MINQIGYNTRKDDELLRCARDASSSSRGARQRLPALTRGGARLQRGQDPGRRSSPTSCSRWPSATPHPRTRARAYFLDLAAKQLTVARGLGFCRRVSRRPRSPRTTFFEILDRAARLRARTTGASCSRELRFGRAGEFYLFEQDPDTGLSSDELSSDTWSRSASRRPTCAYPSRYRFSRTRAPGRVRAGRSAECFRAACDVYEKIERAPRAGRPARPTRSSRRRRSRCSSAATAATAHCPTSRTCAPSRSAPRTSATAPAAAPATGCARCTTPSASGRRPMSD